MLPYAVSMRTIPVEMDYVPAVAWLGAASKAGTVVGWSRPGWRAAVVETEITGDAESEELTEWQEVGWINWLDVARNISFWCTFIEACSPVLWITHSCIYSSIYWPICCIVDLPADQASRSFPLVLTRLCYWPQIAHIHHYHFPVPLEMDCVPPESWLLLSSFGWQRWQRRRRREVKLAALTLNRRVIQ